MMHSLWRIPMQRNELLDQLKGLKLAGMVTSFDETVTQGVRQGQTVQEIIGKLCQAEAADRKVRTIS